MQTLGVAIVGENSVEMAYYPEVAAVLGSARLLPKTSASMLSIFRFSWPVG